MTKSPNVFCFPEHTRGRGIPENVIPKIFCTFVQFRCYLDTRNNVHCWESSGPFSAMVERLNFFHFGFKRSFRWTPFCMESTCKSDNHATHFVWDGG
jgi:hypothetical protein